MSLDDLATPMSERAEEAAATLRLLAHPSRLLILCALVEGQASVSALQDRLGEGQAQVSQQLARLRKMGLVSAHREGRTIRYRLADPRIATVLEALHKAYCAPDSVPPNP